MDVTLWLWNVKNNRASGKRINHAVDKIRVEVNRRYQELMQTDGYVTAAKLKDTYLGSSLNPFFSLLSFSNCYLPPPIKINTQSYIFGCKIGY